MATPQRTPELERQHRETLQKLEEQLGRVILGKPEDARRRQNDAGEGAGKVAIGGLQVA